MQLHVVELHVGGRRWADRARARCRVRRGGCDEAGRLLRHLRLRQHRLDQLRAEHAVPGCGRPCRLHRVGGRRSASVGAPASARACHALHAGSGPCACEAREAQALRRACRPAPRAMHAGTASRMRAPATSPAHGGLWCGSRRRAEPRARCPAPGGVNVALPTNITAEDVAKVINEAELVGMACSVDELATLAPVLGACATLRTFVVMEHEGCANPKLPALVKQARRPCVRALQAPRCDAGEGRRGCSGVRGARQRTGEACGRPERGAPGSGVSVVECLCVATAVRRSALAAKPGRSARVSIRAGREGGSGWCVWSPWQRQHPLLGLHGQRVGALQALVRHRRCLPRA